MDYKEILDFESRKLLGLFNLLKSTENNNSLEKLSRELNINAKTIVRSMKKLNQLFKRYQLADHLTICSRAKKYFYIKRDKDIYLELFLVQFLNDLPEVTFLKAIIEEEDIQAKQLAKHLLISESSMRRRVKKINEWLKKFNIDLKRGTYQLMGEEEQIRALILHFYWFAYQGTDNKFLLFKKEKNQQLTDQLVLFFQMQINDLQKETIFRIVQITIWRYQKGKKILIKEEWKQYIENSSIFFKFVKVIRKEVIDLDWDFEELAYLYLIIQASFLPYFGSSMQAYIIEEHYLKKTTCFLNTLIVTNKFRRVFWDKKFSHSKTSVVAFLGFHLYYELISGFLFEKNQSVKSLQTKYPNFMRKLDEGLFELIKKHEIYQRIPNDALWYRYFMILSSLISPVYNEKRLFVCLMTDLPLEKETELGQRITDFFSNTFNLVVIYARTSHSIAYADIVLTTVFYQALNHKYNKHVLIIEPDFSETVFFQIEKLLKKVSN
ncbi:helix-turn-helix domain-containing protein [Enterococcus sp. AZ126]|uniref:helix-turn-helix domain-containing protein n=1 Tax=Enterococcus sp. AZ126 TaxID=2774635 RepID=UPI003F298BD8